MCNTARTSRLDNAYVTMHAVLGDMGLAVAGNLPPRPIRRSLTLPASCFCCKVRGEEK